MKATTLVHIIQILVGIFVCRSILYTINSQTRKILWHLIIHDGVFFLYTFYFGSGIDQKGRRLLILNSKPRLARDGALFIMLLRDL